jgi:hypothetical protein
LAALRRGGLLYALLAVSVRLEERFTGDVERLFHRLGIEALEALRERYAEVFQVSHTWYRLRLVSYREVDLLSRRADSRTHRMRRRSRWMLPTGRTTLTAENGEYHGGTSESRG